MKSFLHWLNEAKFESYNPSAGLLRKLKAKGTMPETFLNAQQIITFFNLNSEEFKILNNYKIYFNNGYDELLRLYPNGIANLNKDLLNKKVEIGKNPFVQELNQLFMKLKNNEKLLGNTWNRRDLLIKDFNLTDKEYQELVDKKFIKYANEGLEFDLEKIMEIPMFSTT